MISAEEGRQLLFGQVRKARSAMYGNNDIAFVEKVIHDVIDLFNGKRKGFLKADTSYHDLAHTVQTVQPFVEIIQGWNSNRAGQPVSHEFFDLGVVAVLLHDTGSVKREDDLKGSGAKFTFVHIQRSIDFAGEYLRSNGLDEARIGSVQKAIRCTGVRVEEHVPFDTQEEQIIGYALGSADLLGQMAAQDYIVKLPRLFDEFAEAYEYEGPDRLEAMGIQIFKTAEDLIRSTPSFYRDVAQRRLRIMGSLHEHINCLHENGRNPYIEAIEENIRRIGTAYP